MRYLFGRTHADWVIRRGPEVEVEETVIGYAPALVPDTIVTFWDAREGGSEYTDLLDLAEDPLAEVRTDDDGNIEGPFWGPDGVTYMWASASVDGSEPRYLMSTPTLGDQVTTLDATAGETWTFSSPQVDMGAAYRAYNQTGRTLAIEWVHASAGVAPSSIPVEVDVLVNGSTSLFNGVQPDIPASQNTSDRITALTVDELADGEYLTVDLSGDETAAAIVVLVRVR